MQNKLYTIGYSPFSLDNFISILHACDITAIADVRAWPWISHFEDYKTPHIERSLKKNGIAYVHMGDVLGVRPENSAFYTNDAVDFAKLALSPEFNKGLERLAKGLEKYSIALMCAEKDPIKCHRSILLTHSFRKRYPEFEIFHIQPDVPEGFHLESQQELDCRLQGMFRHIGKTEQYDLLGNKSGGLEKAYQIQGEKIAWKKKEDQKEPN